MCVELIYGYLEQVAWFLWLHVLECACRPLFTLDQDSWDILRIKHRQPVLINSRSKGWAHTCRSTNCATICGVGIHSRFHPCHSGLDTTSGFVHPHPGSHFTAGCVCTALVGRNVVKDVFWFLSSPGIKPWTLALFVTVPLSCLSPHIHTHTHTYYLSDQKTSRSAKEVHTRIR